MSQPPTHVPSPEPAYASYFAFGDGDPLQELELLFKIRRVLDPSLDLREAGSPVLGAL